MSPTPSNDTSSDAENSVFGKSFDKETQQALMAEDTACWNAICGLLMAVIIVGLILAGIALTFVT
ncbi:MAG: hypothetical protein ABGX07_09675 [Pirellulaceae bacterium]|jgi:hypothetical protein|nr:hypothetical protein [Planctomycetaceae bacterium]HIM31170.1 hypothetical protein [Planctomycetota bacterium]